MLVFSLDIIEFKGLKLITPAGLYGQCFASACFLAHCQVLLGNYEISAW